jgi:uncharacterized membrane protein
MRLPKTTLLALSVTLNLFLLAAAGTLLLRPKPPQLPVTPDQIEALAVAPLDGSDKQLMVKAFASRHAEIMRARGTYRASLRRAVAIIGQPGLDSSALRAEAERAKLARTEMNGLVVDALIDGIEHISPDGRRALVSSPSASRLRKPKPINSETP